MKLRKAFACILAVLLMVSAVPAFDVAALAERMPYFIEVDLTNQMVTIYSNDSEQKIVRQMLCSAGVKDSTVTGTFTLPTKTEPDERTEWYYFNGFHVYAMYATRIYKGIMFHSIPCNHKTLSSIGKHELAAFGSPDSHGCVRLRWQDAEFIAKNCLPGTKVKIFYSGKRDEDIRALLMQSSYTGENGQSYKAYLGIPDIEGVMGRFSKGNDVKELQMRLRDLGIYAGEVDGDYRGSTVTAVRKAQQLLGMETSGIATLEFQEAIRSGSAPADLNVSFQEGNSGPAIRNMQQYLTDLGLYDSDVDGIFDVEVVKAVKRFQSCYGFPINGKASSLVQKAIAYEAGRVKAIFSMSGGYTSEALTDYLVFGTVDCKVGIRLRKNPDAKSEALTSMANGDTVVALEYGDPWSKVMRGRQIGYVMNQYMKYYKQEITAMRYTAVNGDETFTLGYSKEDYYQGATLPAEAFARYLSSGGEMNSYKGMVEYATVKTESEDLKLNLREQPNTSSTILAELPYGTQVKVMLHSNQWTLVAYNGQNGYLLNEYLEYWNGPENAGIGEAAEEEISEELLAEEAEDKQRKPTVDDLQYAVVSSEVADGASVYAEDSLDSAVLGSLKNGVRLTVVESMNGWNKISLQGHEGYMKDEDLKFVLDA